RLARTARAVERDLIDLAPQSDQKNTAEIRVATITVDRSLEQNLPLAFRRGSAARAVDDRHETVDSGKPGKEGIVRRLGNRPADGGGTVHAGDDADIVARSDATVGPSISHEAALHGRLLRNHRLCSSSLPFKARREAQIV